MPEKRYLLIDSGQNAYYYNEEELYKHLNEDDTEEDDKVNIEVLDGFPLPDPVDAEARRSWIKYDSEGRPFSSYCPFDDELWPESAVLVFDLQASKFFVPEKKERVITKKMVAYGPPETPKSATKKAAAKAPAKKAAKAAAKSTR